MFARGHHAVGRQRVLVPFRCGNAADNRHDRVAVEKDFFDVMSEIEKFKGTFQITRFASKRTKQIQQTLTVRSVGIPGRLDIDMVSLHVEDELGLWPFLAVSFLVFDFGDIDGKAIAENLVHRQQPGGHTAARAQKLATRKSLCLGRLLSQV